MRWGFLSTAKIANDYFPLLIKSGESVVAVASRSIERAKEWSDDKEPKIDHLLDSYEDLIALSDVDVVYLPIPTGIRTEFALKSINSGKHVLIEKPISVTSNEAKEMLNLAKDKKVLILDGTMWMHHERTKLIYNSLYERKLIGSIQHITCTLTSPLQNIDSNIRTKKSLEPHGCLGDLGWYCIRWILFLMNNQLPIQVIGHYTLQENQEVPFSFNGVLMFKNGESASFYCSFLCARRQNILISGSEGQISFENFVTRNNKSDFTIFKTNEDPQTIDVPECNQTLALITEFIALSTEKDDKIKYEPFEQSVNAMIVLDSLLESANTKNPVVIQK